MSVIVKNMDMPRGCRECLFINAYICDGSIMCMAMGKQIASNHEPIEYEGRHPDCPLEDANNDWIPVEERLPEDTDTVLITHKNGVYIAWYTGSYWEHGTSTRHTPIKIVEAWRPLPKPYEQKEDKQ